MSRLVEQVRADFEPAGVLARHFPDYIYREQQVLLAEKIATTIETGGSLIAEAETGTGKTMAYLLPALHSSGRVLISTHTKALQDQLVHRDLPTVQQALSRQRKVALLKGRSNYLCPHRLEKALAHPATDMWQKKLLASVRTWADSSVDGDLSGLSFDVFEKGIGTSVTATAEQCLGHRCAYVERCPLMQARQRAQSADIVVCNHSLLLADAVLKRSDYGEVLPEFDVYILDEAHALPDLASQHFGIQLTRTRLIQWFNDMQAVLDELGDEPELKKDLAAQMQRILKAYQNAQMEQLEEIWTEVNHLAADRAARNEDLYRLAERATGIAEELSMVRNPGEGYVGWSEGEGEERRFLVAPLETGAVLADHLWQRDASFVLLSATLRVSGRFEYAKRRLGLAAETSYQASPFDYASQALIYLPRHLDERGGSSDRSANGFQPLCEEMERLLLASDGRAFVLFTSWQALRQVAPVLGQRLPWRVLVQGESGSRDAILEEFRKDKHSVLCGTRSFWEGVDVPGEALSMVIIDKMPFAPPNDPLLRARIRHCEEQGGNGFRDIQLPEAIAVLRQGAGRLIRSEKDRGVMALLDSRLYHKGYGREVVRNLPPAPITDNLDKVRAFFSA